MPTINPYNAIVIPILRKYDCSVDMCYNDMRTDKKSRRLAYPIFRLSRKLDSHGSMVRAQILIEVTAALESAKLTYDMIYFHRSGRGFYYPEKFCIVIKV